MKRKESNLACLSHYYRSASYDVEFFKLFLQDVWESIEHFGSVKFQLVIINNRGHLDCVDYEIYNYLNFLEFIDSKIYSFNPEFTLSLNIRLFDYSAGGYYSLFSVYKEIHERLYRRFQDALL